MKTKYVVKQDGKKYYVVALSLSGLELWVKGSSTDKQEMYALADRLNQEPVQ